MADIAAVVDKSDACNVSQLVYNKDAEVVAARDWATGFPTLEDHQQSTVVSSSPPHSQEKFVGHHAYTPETPLSLLRDDRHPVPDHLPPQIEPKDLSDEKQ